MEWDDFVTIQNQDKINIQNENKISMDKFSPSTKYMDAKGNDISFHQSYQNSFTIASNADVLIAADVVYDRSVIPQLVQVVKSLLTSSSSSKNKSEKVAIFATTFRNADTFALFENELEKCENEICCDYVDSNDIDELPYIFPCYYHQPRSHVRICIISVKNET